jgi:hypothetical protein
MLKGKVRGDLRVASTRGVNDITMYCISDLPYGVHTSTFNFKRGPQIEYLVWESNNVIEVGFGGTDRIHVMGSSLVTEQPSEEEDDEEETSDFFSRFYISRKNKVSRIELNLSQLKARDENYDFVIIIKSGPKVDQFTFRMKNSGSIKVERVQDTFKIHPL